MTSKPGLQLHDLRLFNDQDGNLTVGLWGTGPFPIVAWTIPRDYVAEILDLDMTNDTTPAFGNWSGNIVQLLMSGGVSLHYPPGSRAAQALQSGQPATEQAGAHLTSPDDGSGG